MATTWGLNTWGSNSWESDQNFANPSSATISVAVDSVTAFPEQGWGGKQWSINEWGELTDVTVSLTGQELTSSLGTETVEAILNRGWGRQVWGGAAWGIGGSVLPDGQQLQTTLASVTVTNEINIGWGGLAWGVGEWGDLANPDIIQTGIAMTSNTQDVSITADANVDATGSEITSGTDGAVGGTSVDLIPTGEELTSNTDGVFAGELVTVEVSSPSNDEWGTDYWGAGQFGVGDGITIIAAQPTLVGTANIELTSNQLSISEGTVDPAPDAMVTGVGMTIASAVGTVTADGSVNVTGLENTASTEIPTVIGTANIEVTGNQITGQTGQLEYEAKYEIGSVESSTQIGDAFGGEVVEVQVTTASAQPWGETAWGDGEWGQSVGTDIAIGADAVLIPSIDVPVTGEQLNWTIGTETITADANVFVTGVEAESLQGNENAFTDVTVEVISREENNISIGNFVAGISQLIVPTGLEATTTSGTIGINAWAVVETSSNTTWTVVDKAAA